MIDNLTKDWTQWGQVLKNAVTKVSGMDNEGPEPNTCLITDSII